MPNPSPTPITEQAFPALLDKLDSPWGATVKLEFASWDPTTRGVPADYHVRIHWQNKSYEFVAEAKGRSTPQSVDQALYQAQGFAKATGFPPMIIVPYLDQRQLDRLVNENVSGIDLSGNGIVIVPGKLLLRSSGQPNRYPESQPTKYAYRGVTSIVPRVFLSQSEFNSVNAIKAGIEARGGSVALSTVSKALTRMKEDLLIERRGSRILLLQPDVLLNKLRDSFTAPVNLRMARVDTDGKIALLCQRVNKKRTQPLLSLSGASSQIRYSAGIRSDEPIAYCESLKEVRQLAGKGWKETERFADLTIIETSDRTPFFNTRQDDSGLTYASPIQSYLELAAGDKRDLEMAEQIRKDILRNLNRT